MRINIQDTHIINESQLFDLTSLKHTQTLINTTYISILAIPGYLNFVFPNIHTNEWT